MLSAQVIMGEDHPLQASLKSQVAVTENEFRDDQQKGHEADTVCSSQVVAAQARAAGFF